MQLIVFSHLRWNFVYQRPQHLLSRLAAHWRVIFVEEPVADAKAVWLDVSSPAPNITVLRPHTTVAGAGFSDAQLPVIADQLGRYLDGHHIVNYVAWFYTPLALPLLDELAPRAVVYDCMDELAAFKNPPPGLREREAQLLRIADLVLTGGPGLYAAKRDRNPNVVCLPSAGRWGSVAGSILTTGPTITALQCGEASATAAISSRSSRSSITPKNPSRGRPAAACSCSAWRAACASAWPRRGA